MNKVVVRICTGTTCFLMGASQLQMLEEYLPEDLKPWVTIVGSHCLGYCKSQNYGKAPFVRLNDKTLSDVTLPMLVNEISRIVREGE